MRARLVAVVAAKALGAAAIMSLGFTAVSSEAGVASATSPPWNGIPVGIPPGPQASVSDCPSDPHWIPSPPPAGSTVTVSLASANTPPGMVNGTAVNETSTCTYTVSFPKSDSGVQPEDTVFDNLGYYFLPYGGESNFILYSTYYGGDCYSNYEIGTYAWVQEEYWSGYCNTGPAEGGYDGFDQVVDLVGNLGNQAWVQDFRVWHPSYVPDGYDAAWGGFEACIVDTSYYFCGYLWAGPQCNSTGCSPPPN